DSTVTALPNYTLPPSSVNVGYNRDFSFLMGMNTPNDKGNATFYATYRTADPILQASFDYSACTLNSGDTFSCGGSTTTAPPFSNRRFRPLDPTSGAPTGPNAPLRADGSLQTFPSTTAFAAAQAYNFGPLNYYARPDERYTLGAFVHYDVAEHAKVYSELMYMNDRNVSQIAPSGAFSLGNPINPGGGLFVNCDNPLLSAAMVSTWCAPGSTILRVGEASVTGDLGKYNVQLPTARNGLNVNIGVDWNQTTLHFQPDFAFQTAQGAGQGSATLPAGGSVTARELFLEGKLPIVEDHPGAEVFGAEFGYRYSDYSQAQSDNGSAKQ